MSQEIKVENLSEVEVAKLTREVIEPLILHLNKKSMKLTPEFIENVLLFHANKKIFDPNLTVFGTKQITDFVAEYFGATEPVFTDVTKAVMARIMRQGITELQYPYLFDDFESNYYNRIK
ncbi:hypothetical protein SIL04_17005 [Bacillus cereus group sp. BfR-BA-00331]|uniref:hypothetical protein n=1 Tax=Bacillus cereus group TaxID=86661 RepID=UPI000772C694|nr:MULTISPECIES: hypothetical protein [Bacillus cereus group]ONG65870.1 hypothetical protein BKK44_23755 [Bacillus cereus]MDA2196241.1 hypothetical protein [Bacillus cereus group sp. Bc238]MDA2201947.1 hypothetical protein [Bacillus cereus group sp. Bc237]MDA2756988.1 hypothetical protein [Bacillus cereus group sp. Bc007]MDA2762658.1 hypothetical protein [Bacillus cereus group sp. Bc008]